VDGRIYVLSFLFCFFETGSHYVTQADLKFTTLLPLPSKWWVYRCALPYMVQNFLTKNYRHLFVNKQSTLWIIYCNLASLCWYHEIRLVTGRTTYKAGWYPSRSTTNYVWLVLSFISSGNWEQNEPMVEDFTSRPLNYLLTTITVESQYLRLLCHFSRESLQ
jgi:hypothetical protein